MRMSVFELLTRKTAVMTDLLLTVSLNHDDSDWLGRRDADGREYRIGFSDVPKTMLDLILWTQRTG